MGGASSRRNWRLRQAGRGDLASILAVEEEVFGDDAFSRVQLAYLLRAPRSVAAVATAGGEIGGFLALNWRLGFSGAEALIDPFLADYRDTIKELRSSE